MVLASSVRSDFRADIQGLRAIAVTGVVIYHSGAPFLTGGFAGVDVFFVVSGFLITNHLLAQLTATRRIHFAAFYARRALRILPAAFVTLALTAVATVIWLPRVLSPVFLQDAVATAFYVPNLLFAARGTDYLAETAPSPFQQYWSLGVEEQFYLLWPLALFCMWRITRRSPRALGIAVGILVALSFSASALLTFRSQPWAFFSSPTRAWELGLGGLVAMIGPGIVERMPRRVRAIGSWVGLAGIATSFFVLDTATAYPGLAALWPVSSTALLILVGIESAPRSAGIVLATRPAQALGRISYSVYLVHWPLLVVPALATVEGELPFWLNAILGAAALPVGWLMHRLVEIPPQRRSSQAWRRPAFVLSGALALSVVIGGGSALAATSVARSPLDSGRSSISDATPRAAPTFSAFVPEDLTPSLRVAPSDLPTIYANGCQRVTGPTPVPENGECSFGDLRSDFVVALFGDSHAAQWFPALEALGRRQGFRLDVYTKSSCPSVDVPMVTDGVLDADCAQWRDQVVGRLVRNPPSRIVIANFSGYEDFGTTGLDSRLWSRGLAAIVERLVPSAPVTIISDTPRFPTSPATCLSAHLDDALACAVRRDQALDRTWVRSEASAARAAGADVVDLSDYLCSDKLCGSIVGNRLLYRDRHHLTASYARLLADALSDRLGPLGTASSEPPRSPSR